MFNLEKGGGGGEEESTESTRPGLLPGNGRSEFFQVLRNFMASREISRGAAFQIFRDFPSRVPLTHLHGECNRPRYVS